MDTKFVYIDDSSNDLEGTPHEAFRVEALTGVLVPARLFADVREGFYYALFELLDGRENSVWAGSPELRGSDLLRDETMFKRPGLVVDDEIRFRAVENVLELISRHGLELYRSAHCFPKMGMDRYPPFMRTSSTLRTIAWWLDHTELDSSYLVTVMDAKNQSHDLGLQMSRTGEHVSAVTPAVKGGRVSGLLQNQRNMLGELFFVDSKASALIQIADIAGYLLKVREMARFGQRLTDYKQRLLEISEGLTGSVVVDSLSVNRIGIYDEPPKELEYTLMRGAARI